jgi:putative hydrolase of the HAD superfamily
LRARLNLSPEVLAELRHDFWAGDCLDAELVALIRSLRSYLKTALLSNFPASLRALLTELGLTDAFDVIVISGEVGVVKPDARIYHLAAERLRVPAADCLFVDDFVENVVGARGAGMQTFHFAPPATAVAELRRMTTWRSES